MLIGILYIIIAIGFFWLFLHIRLKNRIRFINSLEKKEFGEYYYQFWMDWYQRQIKLFYKPSSPIYDSIFRGVNKNAK